MTSSCGQQIIRRPARLTAEPWRTVEKQPRTVEFQWLRQGCPLPRAATLELSRPCFGVDARHQGCAQLFHSSLNGFAAAFLKGVVQCWGIGTKSSVTTACLLGRSFDSLKHDLGILFSV